MHAKIEINFFGMSRQNLYASRRANPSEPAIQQQTAKNAVEIDAAVSLGLQAKFDLGEERLLVLMRVLSQMLKDSDNTELTAQIEESVQSYLIKDVSAAAASVKYVILGGIFRSM